MLYMVVCCKDEALFPDLYESKHGAVYKYRGLLSEALENASIGYVEHYVNEQT